MDALRNEDFFGVTLRPEMASDRDYSSDSANANAARAEKAIKATKAENSENRGAAATVGTAVISAAISTAISTVSRRSSSPGKRTRKTKSGKRKEIFFQTEI